MTDVLMPQMGESIAEGTITKWLKRLGDRVEQDEPLFEISTDKVDAEIPAPAAGVLAEIRFEPGTTLPVNTVVAIIAAEDEAQSPPSPAGDQPVAAAPVAVPAADLVPRPTAPSIDAEPPAGGMPPVESSADELRRVRSSPVVRRIASEHDVDIQDVPGTGIGGRVTKEDLLGYIATRAPLEEVHGPESSAAAEGPAPPSAPTRPTGERVEIVPMSPIRKRTAEHMLLSRRTSAHVTTVFELDMTRVDQLRAQHRQSYLDRSGVNLTYLPFVLKATIDALKAFPILNSSVEGDAILYRKDINIGLAVALDWGLIVPVIRNADEKNVLGLARAAQDLAERARGKRLKVEEVQGGTFTITNPGVFGSLFGTPIISQPQVAILSIGAIEKRPVVRHDAIAIRTLSFFALSFDHRVVDGADADRFMAHVKRGLEEFDETSL